ncbi:hypothetical protein SLEP1_g53249 [Rubroshorea leprosula]|uniref:Uncharacterized protein n=1 Tax=Rubroshorea leprosula TaxID=152421 RepID=A0AAV5M914_9ROSI|nr:hypothetical protein SLEP1_g53249 [Rubroshorea leprosula]
MTLLACKEKLLQLLDPPVVPPASPQHGMKSFNFTLIPLLCHFLRSMSRGGCGFLCLCRLIVAMDYVGAAII